MRLMPVARMENLGNEIKHSLGMMNISNICSKVQDKLIQISTKYV